MCCKKNKIEKILKKNSSFKIINSTYIFNVVGKSNTSGDSFQGRFQNFLKKFGRLYNWLIMIFGPVISTRESNLIQKKLLKKFSEDDVVLNIGSGPSIYKKRQDFINIDLFNFNCTDIVTDAIELPIIDRSVDHILNMAMLEHVPNPKIVVNEMFRVLKPKGDIICYVPFIVPFHAAPYDYCRWTKSGVQELFNDFNDVNICIGAGPTSAFLWIFQEWFSLLFSFGNTTLKDIIFIILMLITFPIKYFDLLLVKHPNAEKIASGFYIHAKK